MVKKMFKTTQTIEDYIRILQKDHETLKEYGDFIDGFNKIMADSKKLQAQKNQIEGMQSQLKKLEGSINPEHGRNLQLLKERYNNLLNDIKKANDIIESKRSGMMTNITN